MAKTDNSSLIVRNVREWDSVAAIARCIHLTDNYIYPQICTDPKDLLWIEYVDMCLHQKDNLFFKDNLMVAEAESEICGFFCVIQGGREYVSECKDAEICNTDAFVRVSEGYFEPLINENLRITGATLTNLCVLPDFRNRHVGQALLGKCIEVYGRQDIHLDVLAENDVAKGLYKKNGFVPTEYYDGFGNGATVPCVHMMREASN